MENFEKKKKAAKTLEALPKAPVENALHQEFEHARALWKEKGWKALPHQT